MVTPVKKDLNPVVKHDDSTHKSSDLININELQREAAKHLPPTLPPPTYPKKEVVVETKVDLDKDFAASAKRLEELKRGRTLSDLPLTDEYWIALAKHRKAHGK